MSSLWYLRKSLFNRRSAYKSLTFSHSYRLNSRTSIRETLAQSRERSETFTMPITNPPFGTNQSKTGDKGVHVVSILIPSRLCSASFGQLTFLPQSPPPLSPGGKPNTP